MTTNGRQAFLVGLGAGAGLMFLLDPQAGRRRRARLRDRVVRSAHKGADAFGATRRDLSNRTAGAAARLRGLFQDAGDASDAVVANRVRTALGRLVSYPRAIDVEVVEGCVTLRGPILQDELDGALTAVHAVPGVGALFNELQEYEGGDIPALQGQAAPRERDFATAGWSPTARLAAGAAAAMLTWGLVARAMAHPTLSGDASDIADARQEVPPADAM